MRSSWRGDFAVVDRPCATDNPTPTTASLLLNTPQADKHKRPLRKRFCRAATDKEVANARDRQRSDGLGGDQRHLPLLGSFATELECSPSLDAGTIRVRVSLDHDQALRGRWPRSARRAIEERKAKLARLLVDCQPALALNRVFDHQGVVIFEHACKLGRLRMLAAH